MYDIKKQEVTDIDSSIINEPHRVHDRFYYKKHLTDNILTTKSSLIPTDSLF